MQRVILAVAIAVLAIACGRSERTEELAGGGGGASASGGSGGMGGACSVAELNFGICFTTVKEEPSAGGAGSQDVDEYDLISRLFSVVGEVFPDPVPCDKVVGYDVAANPTPHPLRAWRLRAQSGSEITLFAAIDGLPSEVLVSGETVRLRYGEARSGRFGMVNYVAIERDDSVGVFLTGWPALELATVADLSLIAGEVECPRDPRSCYTRHIARVTANGQSAELRSGERAVLGELTVVNAYYDEFACGVDGGSSVSIAGFRTPTE